MKKHISAFLIVSMLAIMAPIAASAQTSRYYGTQNSGQYRGSSRSVRTYRTRTYNDGYYNDGYRRPNVYQRNRTGFNLAIGTGVGAVIGALIGGKKGALIGGAAGLGGGAIVTAVQKKRNNRRY